VSTGTRGYLRLQGRAYALTKDQFARLDAGRREATSGSGDRPTGRPADRGEPALAGHRPAALAGRSPARR